MSWAKLDDGFWMHPKIIAAGNVGAGIFARFLSYCGAYLTDGAVPGHVVQMIVAPDQDAGEEALRKLDQMNLIERYESGAVMVLSYLEHNRSKAHVEADREQRARNGRRGGRPAGSNP